MTRERLVDTMLNLIDRLKVKKKKKSTRAPFSKDSLLERKTRKQLVLHASTLIKYTREKTNQQIRKKKTWNLLRESKRT